MTTAPPPSYYGALLSTLPPDPRLPMMPSDEELDAIVRLLNVAAQRDADRRAAKYNKTIRPGKVRKA